MRARSACPPGAGSPPAWEPLAPLCGHREGEAGRGLQRSSSEGQRRATSQSQSCPQLCDLRSVPNLSERPLSAYDDGQLTSDLPTLWSIWKVQDGRQHKSKLVVTKNRPIPQAGERTSGGRQLPPMEGMSSDFHIRTTWTEMKPVSGYKISKKKIKRKK